MKYTKEQKREYFKKLRARWMASKELADNDETAKALYKEVGGDFSYHSFYFTLQDMKRLGYDGVPYINCKTYNGWLKAGYQVKKSEKSKISGITWIKPIKEEEEEKSNFIYPKIYKLFHKSQVEKRKV